MVGAEEAMVAAGAAAVDLLKKTFPGRVNENILSMPPIVDSTSSTGRVTFLSISCAVELPYGILSPT